MRSSRSTRLTCSNCGCKIRSPKEELSNPLCSACADDPMKSGERMGSGRAEASCTLRWYEIRDRCDTRREEAEIDPLAILIKKLKEHSRLKHEDLAEIRRLPYAVRRLDSNEDFIRQGDRPKESAIIVEGMVARYHLLPDGARQYLSFHLAGDMPDLQCLFY